MPNSEKFPRFRALANPGAIHGNIILSESFLKASLFRATNSDSHVTLRNNKILFQALQMLKSVGTFVEQLKLH